MGANPFLSAKSDAEVEKLVEDASTAAHADAEKPEAAEGEPDGAAEETDDEFFGEVDDVEGEPEDEADDDDDLFEDDDDDAVAAADEGDGKKAPPETVPYKRLVKELKRRTALQEELTEAKTYEHALAEAYKDFKNPLEQMRSDSKFMTALEVISKHNIPGLDNVIQAVTHYMQTGEVLKVDDKGNTQKTVQAPAKADPTVAKIVEREAKRVIEAALPANMRAGFRAVAQDYVLGRAENLADLEPSEVKELVRELIREKGFTKDDIYAPAQKEAAKKTVPTGSGRSKPAAGNQKGAAAKGSAEERKAPKSTDEWQAAHDARLAAFVSERGF